MHCHEKLDWLGLVFLLWSSIALYGLNTASFVFNRPILWHLISGFVGFVGFFLLNLLPPYLLQSQRDNNFLTRILDATHDTHYSDPTCASIQITFIEMKLRLHSLATTSATSVFPVPGAPYKRIPDRRRSGHWAKISGYCNEK